MTESCGDDGYYEKEVFIQPEQYSISQIRAKFEKTYSSWLEKVRKADFSTYVLQGHYIQSRFAVYLQAYRDAGLVKGV